MVIVRLIGGLGNQFFQYATARRIADRTNVPLKLDISAFDSYKLHTYKLKHFNIPENFALPHEVARLKGADNGHIIARASQLIEELRPNYRRATAVERHFHFDPRILTVPGNVYLDGYWQSEKYFKDIEPIIRAEFSVKTAPDSVNEAMAQSIRRTQSVSLHIRRGDYGSDAATHQVHGTCSLEYYHTAIERLLSAGLEPHFFIFSDEPQWAQSNLELEYPATFITHNGPDRDYEDLRLMSLCQHHIIANSTFSWWGAWLCVNPEKIVLAPRKWFRTSEHDTRDLIPETWLRI